MATAADLLKVKGTKVYCVNADTTIREALLLMADKDIGALPVMEGETLSGFFSERDFARLLAKKDSFPLDTPVHEVMTKPVISVSLKTKIEDCMQLMTEKHIRHLPVVEKKKLVGLISIGDVVKAIITSQEQFIDQLEGYISGRW